MQQHLNIAWGGVRTTTGVLTGAAVFLASATITVRDAGGDIAEIFSDNGTTALANPFASGSDGEYGFYARNGIYTVEIDKSGYVTETKTVVLYDPSKVLMIEDLGIYLNDTNGDLNALRLQDKLDDIVGTYGGAKIIVPRGALVALEGAIQIKGAIYLQGDGWGETASTASGPGVFTSALKWRGGSSGTAAMLHFKAPNTTEFVYGGGLDGIALIGNNSAYQGLRHSSCKNFHVGSIWIERCRESGWTIDDGNNASSGSAQGYVGMYRYLAGSASAAINSHGLRLRQDGANGSNKGATSMYFASLILTTQDGNGLDCGQTDNNFFDKVNNGAGGTGHAVFFRGVSDGQTIASRKNCIGWFNEGDIYCEAGSRNWCMGINSEGTRVTVEAGATLHYAVLDRQDGRRWVTHSYKVDDQPNLPLSEGYVPAPGGTPLGTAHLGTAGSASERVLILPPGEVETAYQWTIAPSRDWSGGKVYGVLFYACNSNIAASGNVRLKIGGLQRFINASYIGGGSTNLDVESFTVATTPGKILQKVVLRFTVPEDFGYDSHFTFRLSLLGTDVLTTQTTYDWYISGVRLLYFADVGDSDNNNDYRYGQPHDSINDTIVST